LFFYYDATGFDVFIPLCTVMCYFVVSFLLQILFSRLDLGIYQTSPDAEGL